MYSKTGQYGVSGSNFNASQSLAALQSQQFPASTKVGSVNTSPNFRQSKLQRSNYLLEPRAMMGNIHQKTHFKAAISVSRGDACCVKVETNEFGDQFAEISRNIDAIHRSMKDIGHRNSLPGAGSRALQVGAFLQRKRTCASQGRQMRLISGRSGISGRYAGADTNPVDKNEILK